MPPGVFPAPKFRPTAGGSGPGITLRVRTWLKRNSLDEELARGADPAATAKLALRAAQLRSEGGRRRLANALVRMLGDARGANLGAFRMKTRRRHAAIGRAEDDLLALVVRLGDDQPVEVRGAAMTALLLNDRRGPLFMGSAEDLQRAVRAARLELDPIDPAAQENFATAA